MKKQKKEEEKKREDKKKKQKKQILYIQTPDQPPHGGVNVSSSYTTSRTGCDSKQ